MNSAPDDHSLMCSVRDGDLDKLGVLFEKHHRHLYNFFLKQTGHAQSSEDLVQDVFYRILKYRTTYREKGEFTPWMFSIAHNARIDYYRKRTHKEIGLDSLSMPAEDLTPEEMNEKNSEEMMLKQALARLPEDKREVLILSRFHDLKYEEIAGILHCKVGTIKARVHWALKELRTLYMDLNRVTP